MFCLAMCRSSSSARSARRRSSSQRGDSGTQHQVRRGSPQRKATVNWKLIQSGSRKATRPLLASPRAKGMAMRLLGTMIGRKTHPTMEKTVTFQGIPGNCSLDPTSSTLRVKAMR